MKKQIMLCLMGILCGFPLAAQIYKEAGKVNVNELQLAYEMFGKNGEVILLISGNGSQLIDWPVDLCEALVRKGFRVIRFDNRDVGLSSKLDEMGAPDWAAVIPKIGTCDTVPLQYTINDMANDAIGLLDALKIRKAHIVGASMGGAIAQTIAINYPDRTLSLTSIAASSGNPGLPKGDPDVLSLMATPPTTSDNPDEQSMYLFRIYKAMGRGMYADPDSVLMKMSRERVSRSWYPAGSARHSAAIIIYDYCDRREKLKKITVPTIVIHGENDPVVNIAAGREVAASIPGAKLITIPGMGHVLSQPLITKIVNGIVTAASLR